MKTSLLRRSLALALLCIFLIPSLVFARFEGDIRNLVPERPLANAAALIPADGKTAVMDPGLILFTQNYISQNFRDNKTVADLIEALKSGRVKAEDVPPLRIFEHDGALWSLDNRRLFCFKAAGMAVRVARATPKEVLKESYKYSTNTKGKTIEIRGQTDGPIDPSETSGLKDALLPNASARLREAFEALGKHVNGAIVAARDRAPRGGTSATAGVNGLLDRRVAEARDRVRDRAR